MDMASDVCRVVLAGIICSVMLAAWPSVSFWIRFSSARSGTVITNNYLKYHKFNSASCVFRSSQSHCLCVVFMCHAKLLPGSFVLCLHGSPLLEQQIQQFRNVLQWKIQLSGAEKRRRKIVLRITHQGFVKYLHLLQYCIWQLPDTHVNMKKLFVVALLIFQLKLWFCWIYCRCHVYCYDDAVPALFSVSVFQYCILSDGL